MKSLVQTLAVAEYLSFQRAASALGTSQSSVSARIKLLEEDLGVILFERNTRGVRLTEAGREFVDQVREAVSVLDAAIKTAGMNARGERGELWIGVYALTAGWFLDRLLDRFHETYPDIRLHITEATARDAEIMLRESRFDIARPRSGWTSTCVVSEGEKERPGSVSSVNGGSFVKGTELLIAWSCRNKRGDDLGGSIP